MHFDNNNDPATIIIIKYYRIIRYNRKTIESAVETPYLVWLMITKRAIQHRKITKKRAVVNEM